MRIGLPSRELDVVRAGVAQGHPALAGHATATRSVEERRVLEL